MASETGYSHEQLRKLEELFENYKFPSNEQRERWSEDLGISPDEIKCWFSNRALLQKVEETRQENNALRMDNAKLQRENFIIREKLEKCRKCNTCSRNQAFGDLLCQNVRLREKHQRVSNIIVGMLRNPGLLQLPGEEIKHDIVDLELRLAPTSIDEPDHQQ